MQLEILTPDKNIYSGEVTLVKVPGSSGSFEIMKDHAAIISTLVEGELKIESTTGVVIRYQITGGVVEAKNNQITVLAESIQSN